MKKLIVITMAILMIVSCVSTTASAIPANINTWNNNGWEGLDLNTTISEGETVLAKTYTKPILATWGSGYNKNTHDQISFNRVFDEAYNISEMKYLALELYVTDKSIFDKTFIIELTSAGAKDANENNIRSALTKYTTSIGEGWYKIEIPIVDIKNSVNGGLNKANCNYMRMYYDDATAFEVGEGFTFGIRNFGFSEERAYRRAEDEYLDINIWKEEIDTWLAETTPGTYWTNEFWGAKNTSLCPGETVYAKTLTKNFQASWGTGYSSADCMVPRFVCKFANKYNISDMNYLVWNFYVTDASVMESYFIVDLSSAQAQNNQMYRARIQFKNYATDMGDGWYKIEIPMELFKKSGNTTELDKTKCDSIFISYDDGTAYTYDGSFTFGIRSLGFADQKSTEIKNHYIKGASIRCDQPTGMRFMAIFDSSDTRLENAGTANANFGVVLISEKKYAKDPNMTFSEMVAAGIKVPASKVDTSEDGVYGVYAVLTDVAEEHFTDNIVAVPYIDNDFAGMAVTRNIYGVAKLVVADPDAKTEHKQFCTESIIAKGETIA